MRVPDEVLKSVCFLGRATVDEKSDTASVVIGATGFFVAHRSEFDPEIAHLYLVTAKHVTDKLINREFAVRLNTAGSGAEGWAKGHANTRFYIHPDPAVDAAVVRFSFDQSFDMAPVPTEMFLSDGEIKAGKVGPGDEVFMTGAFLKNIGSARNLPILRTGNIAMFPGSDEKIKTAMGEAEVYLIEARSIGGLSGSPVFVRETVNMLFESGEHRLLSAPGKVHLLGVMHGHWDIPPGEKNALEIGDGEKGAVNMGIAIVTPAKKILEIIGCEELLEMRRSQAEKKKKNATPKMDSGAMRIEGSDH
jgi:hypothetical protein